MEKAGQVLTIQTEEAEVSIGDYNIRFNNHQTKLSMAAHQKKIPAQKAPRPIGFKSNKE